jgi:hypothetical protein
LNFLFKLNEKFSVAKEGKVMGRKKCEQKDRLAEWQTGRIIEWQTGRTTDWQTGRTTHWHRDRLAER